MKPNQAFVYHDFHDYLASLLSRGRFGRSNGQVMRRLMRTRNDPIPEYVEDVWKQSFCGPLKVRRPGTIFIDRQGEDVRVHS